MFKNSIQAQIVDGWFLECSSKILASLGAILHVLNCNIFFTFANCPIPGISTITTTQKRSISVGAA